MKKSVADLCFDTVVRDKNGLDRIAHIKIPKCEIDIGEINIRHNNAIIDEALEIEKEMNITVSDWDVIYLEIEGD